MIDEYVDWKRLWNDGVDKEDLYLSLIDLHQVPESLIEYLKKSPSLIESDCRVDKESDEVVLHFGESGGQNESDTVGEWFCITLVLSLELSYVSHDIENG